MYKATKLVWKSPSEHLINGRRFDLELQMYHDPAYERPDVKDNNGFAQAAISVLFRADDRE